MKILIVGSGGREHALAWKLSQEAEVHCTPGNPGIRSVAEVHDVPVSDHSGIERLAVSLAVDIVVVGPEDPLIAGLADRLRGAGLAVFGPGAEGAQLEGSKAFSKDCMLEANIPTAEFETFSEAKAAKIYALAKFEAGTPVVVKASGAALGKGVVVCGSYEEAEEAIDSMLVRGDLGEAGKVIVIEDRLIGREFSLLTICSDEGMVSLPVAQDYKRALDGDRGPNTGGMGTVSPVAWVTDSLIEETEQQVVLPMLKLLRSKGISYRGVLFSGLMVCRGKVYCLEYNVRFGDPETQSVMCRLGDGLANLLLAAAKGEPISREQNRLEVLDNHVATVVVASAGYPGAYEKGKPIAVDVASQDVVVFQAGTGMINDQLVTAGGRVLAVTASGKSAESVREIVYSAVKNVNFEGAYYRNDIGH